MKKQALIIALLAATGFISTSAFAIDGTVTITGEVKALTCTVSGGLPGSPSGANFTVPLDPVQASSLPAGASAAAKRFEIQVSDGGVPGNCPAGTNLAINFDLTDVNIDPSNGKLINKSAATVATNAQVEIFDSPTTGTPTAIDLRAGTPSTQIAMPTGGTAILPFAAGYYAKTAATVGDLTTSVGYTLVLN